MKLPKPIDDLVKAQNNFDSVAYASCFSETATVVDEGKTYNGRPEIEKWIANANSEFKTSMRPLTLTESEAGCILKAEISGDFKGSPIILDFNLTLKDGFIQSLKITE